jgi:hypothetical protein
MTYRSRILFLSLSGSLSLLVLPVNGAQPDPTVAETLLTLAE